MLVLKRTQGQGVQMTIDVGGDTIRVHVLEVQGGHVKLGIEAPRRVVVIRSELTEAPVLPETAR